MLCTCTCQWCVAFFSHVLIDSKLWLWSFSVLKQPVHPQRTGVLTWSVIEGSAMVQEEPLMQIYL